MRRYSWAYGLTEKSHYKKKSYLCLKVLTLTRILSNLSQVTDLKVMLPMLSFTVEKIEYCILKKYCFLIHFTIPLM